MIFRKVENVVREEMDRALDIIEECIEVVEKKWWEVQITWIKECFKGMDSNLKQIN